MRSRFGTVGLVFSGILVLAAGFATAQYCTVSGECYQTGSYPKVSAMAFSVTGCSPGEVAIDSVSMYGRWYAGTGMAMNTSVGAGMSVQVVYASGGVVAKDSGIFNWNFVCSYSDCTSFWDHTLIMQTVAPVCPCNHGTYYKGQGTQYWAQKPGTTGTQESDYNSSFQVFGFTQQA